MAVLKTWIFNVLIAIDQLGTALVGGSPVETMSSYAWRMEREGKPWGRARAWIDWLFWPGHCEMAYKDDIARRQNSPT